MNTSATILPIFPPVKQLLSEEEKKLVHLLAQIIVDNTLKHSDEIKESHSLPAYQHRQAK
jgi:hypothetical protein